MHILRLGFQGVELMTTGRLTLPMPEKDRAFVYAVRCGEVPMQEALTRAGELERQIKDLLDDAPVPAEPAREEIEAWMLRMYFHAWKARDPLDMAPGPPQTIPERTTDARQGVGEDGLDG